KSCGARWGFAGESAFWRAPTLPCRSPGASCVPWCCCRKGPGNGRRRSCARCCYTNWRMSSAWICWRKPSRRRLAASTGFIRSPGWPRGSFGKSASGLATRPGYAGHLMDLVRALAATRRRWEDAPAMAEASDLESRVRALLDGTRLRYPLSRRAAVAIASVAAAVLLPVVAITAQAQAARGSLVGVVEDASHARVPNCQVTAKNLDGTNQE